MARWWSRPSPVRALAAAGALALAVPLAGSYCRAVIGVSTGVFVDGERGPLDGSLVGSWRRVEIVGGSAAPGSRSTETTWTFDSEGAVVQQAVARNLSGSLISGTTRRGRWRTEGGVVVVDFTAPTAERRNYTWHVERFTGGERLLLDGVAYARVTG
jgi:hypothetical protein